MDISIFLARTLGIVFIIIPIIVWFDKARVKGSVDLIRRESSVTIFGLFAIFVGSAMIAIHNIWLFGWSGIITLLAWGFFIFGVFSFSSPSTISKIFAKILKNQYLIRLLLILSFATGIYLARIGFLLGI
ncbi:MAG: hypothetical protein WBK67_01035 [Minisyncoccales bacterium]|jgi:hypothetical protein